MRSHQLQNTTEVRNYKKNQVEILELKSTVTKMKNSLEGLQQIQVGRRKQIGKLEDRSVEIMKFANRTKE